MKRGWFETNFGWIANDLQHAMNSLKKLETWITIGLIGCFGLIAWFAFRLALQSDDMLRFVHPAMVFCRAMENSSVLFLFFVGLFFAVTSLGTIGEFFNYLEAKRHKAVNSARRALYTMGILGAIALVLGLGGLLFLNGRCL